MFSRENSDLSARLSHADLCFDLPEAWRGMSVNAAVAVKSINRCCLQKICGWRPPSLSCQFMGKPSMVEKVKTAGISCIHHGAGSSTSLVLLLLNVICK